MAMESFNGLMETATKASFVTANVMEKASAKTKMAVTMLENTKMINHQGKVSTNGKTERATKENGRVVCFMARESRNYQMERSSMETGTWGYRKDWASANTRMEALTMEIGLKDSHMGLGKRLYQTGQHMKEDG